MRVAQHIFSPQESLFFLIKEKEIVEFKSNQRKEKYWLFALQLDNLQRTLAV